MSRRAVGYLAAHLAERSGGRCEAVWHTGDRCPNLADAIHHRLPRSRASLAGDHLLDLAGDLDNLAYLCRPCHDTVHANPHRARTAHLANGWGPLRRGITIDGSISRDVDGTLHYVGTSDEYAARYP